ncbi:MAG: L-histidine N(alpha)-methyltransferase, partial [Bacteriovorax sp.]
MIITKLNGDKDEHRHLEKEQFSFDVSRGLKMSPKKISSKYFYDAKGSRLFQEITKLEEYYLTRAELSILLSIRDVLPKVVGI